MTIRRIRLLGDPVLRAKSDPVQDPTSVAIKVVADDLRETFEDLRSRVGFGSALSAPQIGAPLRMLYMEGRDGRPEFLMNPEIIDIGTDDFIVYNDCFSFPDLLVRVQRAHHIRVQYLDLKGEEKVIDAEGLLAELLQHEIDHLDGVLAVDRATGLDPFFLREEWNKHRKKEERFGEPFTRKAPVTTPFY